jgi:hypothetical protein
VGWLLLLSSGNSHDLLLKKWYISATLLRKTTDILIDGAARDENEEKIYSIGFFNVQTIILLKFPTFRKKPIK